MTFQQLRAFLAVVEHGGLRQAARALGVSQAGLTANLQALERSLGQALLLRSTRGVALTAAGRSLLPRAHVIDREAARAIDALRAPPEAPAGNLDVGLGPTPTAALLHRVVPDYHAQFPAVNLNLVSGLFAELKPQLQDGRLELAVTALPEEGVGVELVSEPLFRSELVAVCRRGHPAATARALRHLVSHEWLLLGSPGSPGGTVTGFYRDHGLPEPRVAATCKSLMHLGALVATTDWLALVPAVLLERGLLPPDVVPMRLRERPPHYVNGIVTRKAVALTPAAAAFAAMCRSCARVLKGRAVGLQ